MNVYFAGIGGVALGPLAEIARDAGYTVCGSDPSDSLMTQQLRQTGITISDDQSGDFLQQTHQAQSVEWFVYTSAMPSDHPEIIKARELAIPHIVKRDEFINFIVKAHDLQIIAAAGTHGKTTTTAMLIWVFQQLNIPVSYSVGSTISYGPSGKYTPGSRYFIYECDEFDRNFLAFSPEVALITSIDYDHPDTYPTRQEYLAAFTRFIAQSSQVIMWSESVQDGITTTDTTWQLQPGDTLVIGLPGAHNRANATLVAKAMEYLNLAEIQRVAQALESFPGSSRRFEKLATNLYTDYGHHPAEIAATLQLAREISDRVVLVYQPHQNVRQHQIRDQYVNCMELAEQIFWLPTYLTREDPRLPLLSPLELTENLVNKDEVYYTELDDELWQYINKAREDGKLVLCMGAGSIDSWVRAQLAQ